MSKKFLIILLILFFYISIIAYSDFEKFSENILQFEFKFLPLILVISFCAMIIKGIRQQLLLKKIGIIMSLKESILLYLVGLSMIVTPGGSGELIKSYFLKKKYGHKQTKTFPIVIFERFLDLVALITIVSFTLLFIQVDVIILVVIIVSLFLILAYVAIRSKAFFTIIIKILKKLPRLNQFGESLHESREVFHTLTSPKNISKNLSISCIAWGVDVFTVYLVFLGFNVDFDIILTTSIVFSSLLFGVLTLVPAGIGVTEISAVGFLIEEGIDLALATTILVMIRLVTIWFSTLMGFITIKLFTSSR